MQRGRRRESKRLIPRDIHAQLRVAVVGAGVAGLCCARRLLASNNAVHVDIFEKSLSVGGRVRTDFVQFDSCKLQRSAHVCNAAVEGFQLDVGFQVLLAGYPTVPKMIDIKALHTRSFGQGAVLAGPNSTPQLLANPLLHPRLLWQTLKTFLSWGLWRTFLDIFLIAWYFVCGWALSSAYERLYKLGALKNNVESFLRRRMGLSRSIVECFFRPFFEAIYVSPLQQQSVGLFDFVLRALAKSGACLPRRGMRAIPEQLAAACQTPISNESSCDIFCSKEVTAVAATEVHVADQHTSSSQHQYDAVVVATDYPAAKLLLKDQLPAIDCSRSATYYFAVPVSALASVLERLRTDGTFIILHTYSHHSDVVADGDKRVPVGQTSGSKASRDVGGARVASIAFPSIVQPSYAPAGTHLAAVTVIFLDDADAQTSESRQASEFDPSVCSDSTSVATSSRQDDEAIRSAPSTSAEATGDVTEAWVRRQVAKILLGKGASVSDLKSVVSSWQHIRTYNIGCHQPLHAHLRENLDIALEPCLPSGVFVCGDHRGFPTIDGAMRSGVRAAEAVLEQFSK